MDKIYEELKKLGVFYIATVEQDQPRVRPFGAVALFEGKVYICTNNQKDVYKQIMENPKIEITGMYPEERGVWMRLQAKVVRDERREAKVAILEEDPTLRKMYSEDDGLFEVFYLEDVHCTRYSFTSDPEVIL